ncbi:MAG: GDSL-type esterase/lipase family protein [Melioribacteraceae bacterium]|nr:GDSL-type esterase/lipase family protein [Melioribacteraceae bacterium]
MKKIIVLTLFLYLSSLNFSQTNNENHLTYLALGDSYTIGQNVAESERFPVQLADGLRNSGYNIEAPLIIAKTGWTTDELSLALDEKEPIGKYDFVTLLIGVNNQYRGKDGEEFRKEFKQLLQRAAGYTDSINNVIVVSIPDWGVTPFRN